MELSTGNVLETLYEHPDYDAARYRSHPSTKQVLYVGYDEDGEHLTWFNKEIETALQAVREKIGRPVADETR